MKYKTEMEIFRRRLRGDVPDHRVGYLVQEMEPFKEEMIPYLSNSLGDGYFTFRKTVQACWPILEIANLCLLSWSI